MLAARPSPRSVLPITALLILGLIGLTHVQLQGAATSSSLDCQFVGPLYPAEVPEEKTSVGRNQLGIAQGALPSSLQTPDSWRMGFGTGSRAEPQLWALSLGAGWYIDWTVDRRPRYVYPEHWQMVRVAANCTHPTPEEAGRQALRYPGGTWIIGNEPDVIWQDNVTPERYAEAYHDFYYAIKAADRSASVAVAGVSQATPLRLDYLDQVLTTYERRYGEQMPVDVWTVHGFVLREQRGSWGVEIPPGLPQDEGQLYEVADHARLDLFESQLRDFRRWMAARGYRHRPLALTEFGILMPNEYGFPPELVAEYLRSTFELLETMTDEETGYPGDNNRLVQRWAWFSLSDARYPTGNLADLEGGTLTDLGWAFRGFVEALDTR